MTVWRMRFACSMSKATRANADTHAHVIRITFPRQQWFGERASTLRDTYIACVVNYRFNSCRTILR